MKCSLRRRFLPGNLFATVPARCLCHHLAGTPVVGGIGCGRIVQVDGFVLPPVPVRSGEVDALAEQQQVIESLEAVGKNYEEHLARAAGKTAIDVLKAHRSIARDPDFKGRLLRVILERQCTAMEALADVQAHFTAMLMAAGSVLSTNARWMCRTFACSWPNRFVARQLNRM